MHIPLLFTIKRSLSIWWKRSVYLNIISTPRSVILSHTSGSTSTTSSTRGWYEVIQVVLRLLWDTARYYKRYYQTLWDITSGTTSHYEALQVALGGTTRCYKPHCESLCGIKRSLRYSNWLFRGSLPKFIFQKDRYEKFYTKYTGNQLW